MYQKLALIFILILKLNSTFAQNKEYTPYCKTVNGEANSLHLLSKEAVAVTHIFDAFPKIISYKTEGNPLIQGNKKEQTKVFYPTFVNSGQKVQVEILVPTLKGLNLNVEFTDLYVLDSIGQVEHKRIIKENEEMFKQMKIPPQKQEDYVPFRKHLTDTHNMLYENAKKINKDYIPSEKSGMIVYTPKGFNSGFISMNGNFAYFEGLVDNQFLLKIKFDNSPFERCLAFESYIREYIEKFKLIELKNKIRKI